MEFAIAGILLRKNFCHEHLGNNFIQETMIYQYSE